MSFGQNLRMDLKRLIQHKGVILTVFILPLVGVFVFMTLLIPLISIGKGTTVYYGICNEDDSTFVKQCVSMLANAESLKGEAVAFPVKDYETGKKLLAEDTFSVYIHVPSGFYESMEAGKKAEMYMLSKPEHSFERVVVDLVISDLLSVVGQSRVILDNAEEIAIKAGVDESTAVEQADLTLTKGFEKYVNRRAAIGTTTSLIDTGKYIPIGYYVAVFFAFLCSMTMLPAIHLTASDLSGPLIARGLLHGHKYTRRYCLVRQLSSSVLIILMLIFPLFFNYIEKVIGYHSDENIGFRILLLSIGIILIAFAFSSFGFLIAALFKRPHLSLWSAFYSILLMAFLSGAFLSEGTLEPWMLQLGLLFPFRATMNIILHTLFVHPMNIELWAQNISRLAGMSITFGLISYCLIRKRDKI